MRTKLPVALSGGKREKTDPVPPATLSTQPAKVRPGMASTRIRARWPTRMRAICSSRRLATTQTFVEIQRHDAQERPAGFHGLSELDRSPADDPCYWRG